jgi:hypothetical protein
VDRCALFVDAGYALSDGALAVHGTRHRDSVSWDYAGLVKLLAGLSRDRTGLPVLRCYWYEATVDSRRTPDHETLADIPGLKLRLGKVRPGRREGVETEIRRDLTALARNKAVSDVIIVSAEEDLSQVISDVQDQGVKVAIMHIAGDGDWTVSRSLRQECDDVIEISAGHLRPYVDLIQGAEPAPAAEESYPAASGSAAPQPAPVLAGGSPLYSAPVSGEYPRMTQPPGGAVPVQPAATASASGPGPSAVGPSSVVSAAAGHDADSNGRGAEPASSRPGGDPSRPADSSPSQPHRMPYPGPDSLRGAIPPQSGGPTSGVLPGSSGLSQMGLPGNGVPGGGLPPSGPPPGGISPNSLIPNGLPGGGLEPRSGSQNGLSGGLPQNGLPGSSMPGGGLSQNGVSPSGLPQNGLPHNGLPQGGPPPGGLSQNGLSQNSGLAQNNGLPPGLPQNNGLPPGGLGPNGMSQGGLPQNGLPQNGMSQNGLPQNGLPQGGLPPSGFGQHSLPSTGSAPGEPPRGGGLPQPGQVQHPQAQHGPPQPSQPPYNQGGPGPGQPGTGAPNGPSALDRPPALPPPRQLPAAPPPQYQSPYPQQQQQQPGPYGGYGGPPSYPSQNSGPYDAPLPQSGMPQPIAMSLADAVQAAHAEGFGFGEAVARDAPALWLEAVLARKPRMPSDLEARLLQGSALPIDSLLHDEVRHALRRGFWDALERSRR